MAYTTIDDPSAHFQIALYTGASGDGAITNDGNSDLQPDMLWVKNRGATQNHVLFDSSRGFNGDSDSLLLVPNETDVESHNDDDHLKSFNSDGFTMQGSSSRSNNNSYTYVAWQWKANGGTTTTNDASATSVGDQDSVYQANTTSRFSIFTYGPLGSGGVLAHGLGVVPEMIFVKSRAGSRAWCVYHHKNTAAPETDHLVLNATDATADATVWNDTAPTSTTVSVSGDGKVGTDETYVAYAFAGVQGYSKFGTYVGNGDADGTFVYTGFKPAFVMMKNISTTGWWNMNDIKRPGYNPTNDMIAAQSTNAEADEDDIDLLSNGFKQRSTGGDANGNGESFIYMAFAEQPFVTSGGVPCTAF
jgi:hypothetical protein